MDPMERMLFEHTSEAIINARIHPKNLYGTRTVIHAKTNCNGYKKQGITFPSSKIQSTLLKEFYEECGVRTVYIPYLEAHGIGTKIKDPEEINAIDRIFTKDRNNPLKFGSVKANLGHTKPASGLCSIAKVIISMESGLIPPNINLNQVRKDVKAFSEGRIKIVTETTPLDGEYIGVNSFGFGGANAHILLKSNPKTKHEIGYFPDKPCTIFNYSTPRYKIRTPGRIATEKPRREKWFSTSISRNEWSTSAAKFS
ncbi:fatty acid synthase-like [Vespula squamosa]|uniref:Fatty acid synthase-like n=1 Tax=Vespula squamosa TaxID=30214 RepID=A0ABD2AF74_VESSQ